MATVEVITLREPVGDRAMIQSRVVWSGQTVAELLEQVRRSDWADDCEIVCTHNAVEVPRECWSQPIAGDGQYAFVAVPGWALVVQVVYQVIVALIIYGLSQLLAPKKDRLGTGVSRLDQESPAAQWNAIVSTYLQGYPIPLVYGERDVGGTVIEAETNASSSRQSSNASHVVIALGHGRFESIGGVTGGRRGEVDNLKDAQLPTPISIDGNTLTKGTAWLRMGEDRQSPIPIQRTGSTILVEGDLNDADDQVTGTVSAAVEIAALIVNIIAPAGSWQLDAQSNYQALPITLEGSWRPVGSTQWNVVGTFGYFTTAPVVTSRAIVTFPFTGLPADLVGPVEVRVRRTTGVPTGGTVSSQLQVVSVEYLNRVGLFAYPGIAHIGISVPFSDKLAVRRPNFRVRCKGRRLRVWDATINGGDPSEPGKTATHQGEYWELPAAGDDYAGIWSYPPGQNPAWQAADMLTSEDALGSHAYPDDRIDWPAFRDLADRCDSDVAVSGANEALFQSDIVIDSPMEALQAIMHILGTARAKLVPRGNKLSVVYQFADAHGRGTNTVPAKARTFLVTSGQMHSFTKHFANTKRRPAVIDMQFADKAKGFAWDYEPVEDPAGGHNDPSTFEPLGYSSSAQQVRGVTRRSQAHREGLFMHAANRLLNATVDFVCGPDALAAEPGDVIGVEHVAMRPFDQESYGYRFSRAVTSGTDVYLDHAVTLAVATTYQVVFRVANGDIETREVTAAAGSYAADAAISVAGAAFNVQRVSPIAVGQLDKVVEDFEVTRISLAQDMMRRVEAVRYDAGVEITSDVGSEMSGVGDGITGQLEQSSAYSNAQPTAGQAQGIQVEAGPNGHGSAVVSWSRPSTDSQSPARVWVRSQRNATAIYSLEAPEVGDGWVKLGETAASEFATELLPSIGAFDVAVTMRNDAGVWQDPSEAAQLLATTLPEFPRNAPPPVRQLTATVQGKGVLLKWSPINSEGLRYYEVRGGTCWIAGHRLGTTTSPELLIANPMYGLAFMVRARFRSGLYSSEIASVTPATSFVPDDLTDAVTPVDMTTWPGTKTDVSVNGSDELYLDADAFEGSWVSDVQDKGSSTDAVAILTYDARYEHDELLSEWTFGVQSGEAHWRTLAGREASPIQPGHNFDEDVADWSGLISDIDDRRGVLGYFGEVNEHARHLVEVKYDSGSWEPYLAERRVHQTAQFRVTLNRRDLDRNLYLSGLHVGQYE